LAEGGKLSLRRKNGAQYKKCEAEQLARNIAEQTGESLTESVIQALRERLMRLKGRKSVLPMEKRLMEIGRLCAGLPDIDQRTPDEVLDYNKIGVPE
jgi:antitoxin VapB